MRFSPSPMILVATLVAAAIVGAVSPANAAAASSDVEYLNIARCAGIAQGLGRDDAALKLRLDAEGRGRVAFVYDRAAEVRADAAREARRAGEDSRRHLIAETDGACAQLTKPATVAQR